MTGRRRIAFAAVIATQALVLLGVIGLDQVALATGDEVTLRTVPVDPVDLFRGQYVTLRYAMSNVTVPSGMHEGDTVYVPLFRQDGYWSGSFGYGYPPPDGKFIRGVIRYSGGDTADVEYGIETYYADADEAAALGRARALDVTVVLDGDGRARVSRVEPVR